MPAYGSGNRSARVDRIVKRKRARRAKTPVKSSGVFGGLAPATAPLTTAQHQAHQRAKRARAQLPSLPLPHVPVIRNPTPAQTRAAHQIITSSRNALVGRGGSAAERAARRAEVDQAFLEDPRMARAIRHYGRVAERQAALGLAKAYGVEGSRQQRIAAGRGLLASRRVRDRVKPGKAHTRFGVGPASIDVTSLGRSIIGQTSFRYGANSPEQKFTANALGDVKSLAESPFIAGYEGGAGAWEAAHGDTSRLERLAKGTWEGIKHSVPGELVQGHPEAAAESFREHPLFAALDIGGATSILGHTAGALTRAVGSRAVEGGVRGSLARTGSTVRPPIALTDDAAGGLVERSYSKDLTRKAAQVARDASREPLRDAEGHVVTVKQRGREVPVLQATRGEQRRHTKKAADLDAARANSVERMVRDQAGHEMRVRGVRGRGAKDLVAMVVEGTITSAKHFREDLESHARRLRGEIGRHEAGEPVYRHTGELKAAQARVALVERVLASPKAMAQAGKIVAAGEEIGRKLNAREREAIDLGLLTSSRAGRSRLVPAAVEHMGARHFTPEELRALPDQGDVTAEALRHGALRHPDGKFMANKDVEGFLHGRGRDPETVAYLPHRLDVRGRRAFHSQFRPGGRGMMEKGEVRTGEAYRKGTTESSAALIQEQGVRQATQIAKARQLDRSVESQGVRRPDGKYFTSKEGLEAADRIEKDTGQRMVPMRAFAAKLGPETQRIIREDLQGPGAMESLGLRLLDDRVIHAADEAGAVRARNVVLMPEAYVKRLQAHLSPAGDVTKFLQSLNRPFRFAVLAQPKWLVGNFVEPFIVRLTVSGAGLNVFGMGVDVAAANRMLRRMDKSTDAKVRQAAQEIRAQHLGGLLIGGRGASVRRSADEFEAYGQMVERLPAIRQAHDALSLAGRALMAPAGAYFRLNRAIEAVAQRAGLGRDVRRDLQEFRGSWLATLRLQKDALDDVGKGLVNTSAQQRFLRSQHELLGKYEGFPPWMRRLTQTAFPFIPWALNSARFTMWTLPAHHTALTALMVKVNDVVAKDWEDVHKGTPPGALRLAIPTKRGGWVDLARYTPFGLSGPVAEGELGGIIDQAFPLFRGPYEALHGRDPFGRELQMSDGEPAGVGDKLAAAGYGMVEGTTPYVGQIRRVLEGGGTGYSDSTILHPRAKPGTDYMSGLRRTFDPFRPTYLHAPSEPGAGRGRRGPRTADERIDAALEQLGDLDALDAEQDDRINRALQSLAP